MVEKFNLLPNLASVPFLPVVRQGRHSMVDGIGAVCGGEFVRVVGNGELFQNLRCSSKANLWFKSDLQLG